MTRADRLLLLLVICTLPLLYAHFWQQEGTASHLQVQAGNDAPPSAPLTADRMLHVKGPLGDSVVEVSRGRARFYSSPCAGQACVHSGWLQAARQSFEERRPFNAQLSCRSRAAAADPASGGGWA